MPNLAMRQPGTQFSADGLDLSWPMGGEREVVAVPDDKMTLRIRRRIAEGHISITDDAATKTSDSDARVYRLLTGEEARKHLAEPAGPVIRTVWVDPEDALEVQELEETSDRYKKAEEERLAALEEEDAARAQRQVEAEKAAAEAAEDEEDEDEDEDPLAEARRRTIEAAHAKSLEADKAFMEKEKERQKAEDEIKPYVPEPVEEPDTSEADKAFMEREKARQKLEAEVAKQREALAEDAASKPEGEPWAGKTSPYVGTSSTGRRGTAETVGAGSRNKATRTTDKRAAAAKAKTTKPRATKVAEPKAEAPKAEPTTPAAPPAPSAPANET